jgi:hypothetical protein
MRIFFLTLAGILTISLAFGQRNINTTRTDKHQQVAGTKVFFVPPVDFTAATTFSGFQQESSGASIMVMEIPGPLAEVSKGFTPEAFKTKQMLVKSKEEIVVNGKSGFLFTTEQQAFGITFAKYVLIFGDNKETTMINGTYPQQAAEVESVILEAMLSVFRDSELVVDPLVSAPFTLDVTNTKLKFAQSISGNLVYTPDGKIPSTSPDRTVLMAGRSLGNVPTATVDKKQAAIVRLNKMPLEDVKYDEGDIKEITIDGISGYEIVAEGLDKASAGREPVMVHQIMLFVDNGYYLLLGKAKKDYDTNLVMFRTIANTFKQK